jgi:hypothetical protein
MGEFQDAGQRGQIALPGHPLHLENKLRHILELIIAGRRPALGPSSAIALGAVQAFRPLMRARIGGPR